MRPEDRIEPRLDGGAPEVTGRLPVAASYDETEPRRGFRIPRGAIWLGIAIVGAIVWATADVPNRSPAPRNAPNVDPPPAAADIADCKARWLEGEKVGLLLGEGLVGGRPVVRVNEGIYLASDYDVKVGIAVTLNCIVAGPGKQLATIDFVSHRTNKVLARWKMGKLIVN